jgi:SAM-dependent methyltransferase
MSANSGADSFLDPRCAVSTLDVYAVRRAILLALTARAPEFHGRLLDVGCGRMPYRSLLLRPPSRVAHYIGLDLAGGAYGDPDVAWDGRTMPLEDRSVDCAIVIEVLEHCPEPEIVLREVVRVLRPGGLVFFTVPFLWPLHDVPHDEYRYTPFALERHLRNTGLSQITLQALGGWDASAAQMLGLWVRRRPMSSASRAILSAIAVPLVRYLMAVDTAAGPFNESAMITGIAGTARKPAA